MSSPRNSTLAKGVLAAAAAEASRVEAALKDEGAQAKQLRALQLVVTFHRRHDIKVAALDVAARDVECRMLQQELRAQTSMADVYAVNDSGSSTSTSTSERVAKAESLVVAWRDAARKAHEVSTRRTRWLRSRLARRQVERILGEIVKPWLSHLEKDPNPVVRRVVGTLSTIRRDIEVAAEKLPTATALGPEPAAAEVKAAEADVDAAARAWEAAMRKAPARPAETSNGTAPHTGRRERRGFTHEDQARLASKVGDRAQPADNRRRGLGFRAATSTPSSSTAAVPSAGTSSLSFVPAAATTSSSAVAAAQATSSTPSSLSSVEQALNPPFRITDAMVSAGRAAGQRVHVIRDDHLVGGTKQRALAAMLSQHCAAHPETTEFVYAGPVFGFAQIALAHVASMLGKRATVVLARQRPAGPGEPPLHPLSQHAVKCGARVLEVPAPNHLKAVQFWGERYVAAANRPVAEGGRGPGAVYMLPFGLHCEPFIAGLAKAINTAMVPRLLPPNSSRPAASPASGGASSSALSLGSASGGTDVDNPMPRLWLVAGSATLLATFARVWPRTHFLVVQVGKTVWPDQLPDGRSELFKAPEPFQVVARRQPPYSTVSTYDAKLWQFVEAHGRDGDFVWNVGADRPPLAAKDLPPQGEWSIRFALDVPLPEEIARPKKRKRKRFW